MSALGSSVINKSGKKFGPKHAPTRRAPTSAQTSSRPSVDRQLQSQTPQPQSLTQVSHLRSPTPPPTSSGAKPTTSQSSIVATGIAAQAAAQNNAAININAIASQGVSIPKPGTTRNAPRIQSAPKDPLNITQVSSAAASGNILSVTLEPPVAVQVTPKPTKTASRSSEPSSHEVRGTVTPLPQHPRVSQRARDDIDDPDQRARKRRRIRTSAEDRSSPPPTDAASQDNDAAPGQDGVATQDAIIGPAAPSQIYSQPIRESIESAQPARPRKTRISRQAKARKRAIEATAADVVADAVKERPRVRKQAKKTRSTRPAKDRGDQEITDNVATKEAQDTVKAKRPKKKHKKRERTPEDAEDIEIIPSQVTMSDLTGNVRTGRRSSRDKELQAMYEAGKAKKKLAKKNAREGHPEDEHLPANEAPTETAEERLERLAEARYDRAVPTTVVRDGRIVLEESSLVIDRHARAAVVREAEAEESVDETELTRRINSSSWLKVDRSGGWNEALTEQFYDGLRMFGTDFYMISKMFPGRTRHSVKLKFNKEEKLNAWRIEATLKGEKLPVNIDEFGKLSNTVFSDPKELEREMDEDRKRIEKEEAAAKTAMEQADKERAEQVAQEAAADDQENNAPEDDVDLAVNDMTKKKKKIVRKKSQKERQPRKKGIAAKPTSGGVTS